MTPRPEDSGEPEHSQAGGDNDDFAEPYWEVTVGKGGVLTATLTETQPALTVSAPDLASLQKSIRQLVMRGML
jgi:hypothetical protein